MKEVTLELIRNFNITNTDFLGYTLDRKDKYSFHHIVKKEYGGKRIYSNGAILIRNSSHNYIHIIESRDLDMFIYLNNILKEINTQGFMPTKNQLLRMWDVLEEFEREHCSDTNRKGEPLIKEIYTKRIII